MRTTLSIADDVLKELKQLARRANRPMTEIANEALRAGLAAMREPARTKRAFKESPVSMGEPRLDLTKALALAAEIEDEEALRKYQLRK
jgi:hypothetical protein